MNLVAALRIARNIGTGIARAGETQWFSTSVDLNTFTSEEKSAQDWEVVGQIQPTFSKTD